MKQLLLNADVGEEMGFDTQIMPLISWCNIACGSHAGNEKVIRDTISLASEYSVKIGAHPSYPDRKNFGRATMIIAYEDLVTSLKIQIEVVKFQAEKLGNNLHHIKPHGALYNDAIKDEKVASAIIDATISVDKSLYLVTTKNSKLACAAKDKLKVKYEVFADRRYNEDLSLVSRSESDAVITDPQEVFDHVYQMFSKGYVTTKKGIEKEIFFDTICVHGDNPKSVSILRYLHQKISELKLNF
ncbi:5-oxoprolinase subunit PxpA [Aquimarina sp. U1-2]|uniref:5-oxoprolinase subunit PxpA n=1 Tax=Aquimarina sp. U1-2 TaxID=2823141 RepID=UPI001AECEE21|nr:5-oxoprolinase subunit PxpA [Aquimarina sp. U1-2]MBP2833631.1 5-oxoprolinase subunit PxpA [Aquimarina sp. U1-2]